MSRALRTKIKHCHRCPLGEFSDSQKWERVPWAGTKSNIAVIGEAPGKNEAFEGEPFVGRAGKVLDKALDGAGLKREQVWIQNVICCRPRDNDFDYALKVGAVEACRPWFNRQLELSGAWMVILVGKRAYQAVMEEEVALGSVRGRFQWLDGRLWLPTWHPAYVLRQGPQSDVASQWWADWRGVGQVLSGEVDVPPVAIEDAIGEQLGFDFPEDTIREHLAREGWAKLYSHAMGDTLIVKDPSRRVKIPQRHKREPVWTTDELVRIGYNGELRVSPMQLKRINLAKRVLGASVVI